MGRRKKITLHDLALAAKVSPASVSRVLSGNPTVDPAIRSLVRKAADKLGMNLESRRKSRSRIIGVHLRVDAGTNSKGNGRTGF